MLEHGGAILAAAKKYGIPQENWLDLSTGINPVGFPVPLVPEKFWLRLPESDDDLLSAAARYYGSDSLLCAAGSQALIRLLPTLREHSTVGVLTPGYSEHPQAWEKAGHAVCALSAGQLDAAADTYDVLVLANPNNPTGERFSVATLLAWHGKLSPRGGWLIVDEAFIDAEPLESLVKFAKRDGLIVLRSLGKFFGLAGARVGFAFACRPFLAAIEEALGPWTIPGPCCFVAAAALNDREWQQAAAQRLAADSIRLGLMLAAAGLVPSGSTALFQWVKTDNAAQIHQAMAKKGILVRHFRQMPSLRFGLPADESGWARLEAALAQIGG